MQVPLQITFRGMEGSTAIEEKVRDRVDKLGRSYDRITSCHVLIEAPHAHHQKGGIFHVRIDLIVPHGEIVVSRDNDQNHAHEDVYVAVRDAFEAAQRQLDDFARKQRGDTKNH